MTLRIHSSACVGLRDHKRAAFTLIELVVGISITGVIFVILGSVFALLMRSERTVMQSLQLERTISRMSEQFRKDVHQTRSGDAKEESNDDLSEVRLLRSGGKSIRYHLSKNGIERQLFEGTSMKAHDEFVLPDCQVQFRKRQGSESTLYVIVVERPGALMQRMPHAPIPLRPLEILAHAHARKPRMSPETQQEPEAAKAGTE